MRSRMFLTINVRMPFCAITDPHQYYYATRCRPSALQVAVPPARVMGQTRRAHARTIPDEFPPVTLLVVPGGPGLGQLLWA